MLPPVLLLNGVNDWAVNANVIVGLLFIKAKPLLTTLTLNWYEPIGFWPAEHVSCVDVAVRIVHGISPIKTILFVKVVSKPVPVITIEVLVACLKKH